MWDVSSVGVYLPAHTGAAARLLRFFVELAASRHRQGASLECFDPSLMLCVGVELRWSKAYKVLVVIGGKEKWLLACPAARSSHL